SPAAISRRTPTTWSAGTTTAADAGLAGRKAAAFAAFAAAAAWHARSRTLSLKLSSLGGSRLGRLEAGFNVRAQTSSQPARPARLPRGPYHLGPVSHRGAGRDRRHGPRVSRRARPHAQARGGQSAAPGRRRLPRAGRAFSAGGDRRGPPRSSQRGLGHRFRLARGRL